MTLAGRSFPLIRPLIYRFDAERAHRLTIGLLKLAPLSNPPASDPRLAVSAFGLTFPNPLGLAAGFDKNAEVPDALLAQGFGFVEVGTLTPRPQAGNPQPRLFRLTEDKAVINRMGFNNNGQADALARLKLRRGRGLVGVNIGANKDSADRIADYEHGLSIFTGVADYLTVNISSPNTPGLRALQSREELRSLLDRLNTARFKAARRPPMLLKIAPDLRDDELEDIAHVCGGGAVDGIIVSNTTLSRPPLVSAHKDEAGGLSGAPLFALSTQTLAKLYLISEGRIPLIGVGGISDTETAWIKLRAGASLLQIYSALIFRGPQLIPEILDGLSKRLAARGFSSLAAAVGGNAREIAHQGLSGT
jgi:dihydroorotate dehydrogenase